MKALYYSMFYHRIYATIFLGFLLQLGLGCSETVTQTGLTGIQLTIRNPERLDLDQFVIYGIEKGQLIFGPETVIPKGEEALLEEESIVILLPDEVADEIIVLRIDGLFQDSVAASQQKEVEILANELVALTMALGDSAVCGDGVIRPEFEECDDGNLEDEDGCSGTCHIEEGFICEGEPNCCSKCGNDQVECDETCDGSDLQEQTCLSQGYRQGLGKGLQCNATCDAFLTKEADQCLGGPIDDEAQISAAIKEAYDHPGHEIIALWDGIYRLTECFVLDECGDACDESVPAGITFTPVQGEVVLVDECDGPVFEIYTGNNSFYDLQIRDADIGFKLRSGPNSGNNVIRNIYFDSNEETDDLTHIQISSNGNSIQSNRFDNGDSGAKGVSAIFVTGEDNTISMNVIYGSYSFAISLSGVGLEGGTTLLDHNSIMIDGQLGSTGVNFNNANGICFRNNIIYGDSDSVGINLNNVSFASDQRCNGVSSQNNVNLNHREKCTGSECNGFCSGSGILCDLSHSPDFQGNTLCLSPGSALVNGGKDLGYDMLDDSPDNFNDSGPEVGARENGSIRSYGGVTSGCL